MTTRERPTNREAVFERDDRTCRHCGEEASNADALRTYCLGPEPAVESFHEALLVTVCTDCFRTLHPGRENRFEGTGTIPPRVLFDAAREFTREQGGAVSTVASFASVATGLPEALEADEGRQFLGARREAALAIDVADARLERLRSVRGSTDDDVAAPFDAFLDSATALQAELRTVLDRGDAVPTVLGRCHGCFEPLDGGGRDGEPCPDCGCDRPAVEEWRADGEVRFDRLFAAITDALEVASGRTEDLTDRSATLAERLTDA